ncbi:phospho-sugar mutase [Nocardia acidivorans]|uniref:phospho-sugar mutase n=1 Tax=Nocardia acidivorans TaxID=404580 RepID=UPI000836B507|nr:phospho-sugar mutase [Nocardia acidivorans]
MLRFGTAGLRGPLQDGPDGMNVETVSRASAGIADWLRNRCLGGGLVIVGRDARHGSAEFAIAAEEVFAAAGFTVLPLPRPLPTPLVAYAVRALGAVAGVQITASHNPATDNGYKLYLDGGSQLVPPADAEIEKYIDAVSGAIPRTRAAESAPDPSILGLPATATVEDMGVEIVRRYLARVAELPEIIGGPIAPTRHGVASPSDPATAPTHTAAAENPVAELPLNIGGKVASAEQVTPTAPNRSPASAAGPTDPITAPTEDAAAPNPVTGTGTGNGNGTGTGTGTVGETSDSTITPVARADIRIALTAMHGVGGELATAALRAAGFGEVLVVAEQFAPDPDFPTVSFPNPEEPGASDLLLDLAGRLDADIAIALDPDADRCAVGVRGANGWRMLRGDETGVLLGDYVLRTAAPDSLVATTIVSSRLLSKLAPARGARYAETLTGFKWLARAGDGLAYAYEEAIGHCVDPTIVRDKDGISAAVVAADMVARLKAQGRTVFDVLDDFAIEFGVHAGDQISLRLADVTEAAAVVERLRVTPPVEIAGEKVTCTDMSQLRGRMRTDALLFEGDSLRVVIRPSGTEPKLKCYVEVVQPVATPDHLAAAKTAAAQQLSEVRAFCEKL